MARKNGFALRALRVLCGAAFIVLAFCAALFIAEDSMTESSYGELRDSASTELDGIDWDSLLSQNPEAVAWLTVEGTAIDYPVAQPGEGKEPDWYLRHDFWGNRSSAGCLYLDRRCDAEGSHMLVFGHHMGLTGKMFSPIFDAYKQAKFNTIGDAIWNTPESGATRFKPLLAMSVDKTYAPIQSFEFADSGEFCSWLETLASDASALADNWEELAASSKRALTLVTCSSSWSGQRARTLLVFVA